MVHPLLLIFELAAVFVGGIMFGASMLELTYHRERKRPPLVELVELVDEHGGSLGPK